MYFNAGKKYQLFLLPKFQQEVPRILHKEIDPRIPHKAQNPKWWHPWLWECKFLLFSNIFKVWFCNPMFLYRYMTYSGWLNISFHAQKGDIYFKWRTLFLWIHIVWSKSILRDPVYLPGFSSFEVKYYYLKEQKWCQSHAFKWIWMHRMRPFPSIVTMF